MSLDTVSPTTFYTELDAAFTTVATAYEAGSGTLVVTLGSVFGSPSPSAPVRITALSLSTGNRVHYALTEVSGNTLTVSPIDGYSDINLAVGDQVAQTDSAEAIHDLQTPILALEAAVNQHAAVAAPLASPVFTGTPQAPTPSSSDSSTALATTAFVKAQNYLSASGNGSGLTGLTGSQITGNITGNAVSITGTISETQVTGLAASLGALAPTSSPNFTGSVTIGSLTGLLKASSGVVSTATAGTDYLTPTGNGSGLTNLNASNLASGTVSTSLLPTSTVTAGSYTSANITVDAYGRITAAANGSGGAGGGTPGGSSGQIQFNSSGSFAGSSNLVYDTTNVRLGIGVSTPTYILDMQTASQIGNTAGSVLNFIRVDCTEPSSNVEQFVVQLQRVSNGTDWAGCQQSFARVVDGSEISGFDLCNPQGGNPNVKITGGGASGICQAKGYVCEGGSYGLALDGYGESYIAFAYDRYGQGLSGLTIRNQVSDTSFGNYGNYGYKFFTSATTEIAYLQGTGELDLYLQNASAVGLNITAASGQTGNYLTCNNSSGSPLASIDKNGAFNPPHLADSAAANNSIYYSTTASKLVYKDSSGTVNNLY